MPNLIKHGELVQDSWQIVDDLDSAHDKNGHYLLPLTVLKSLDSDTVDGTHLGVVLNPDDDIEELRTYIRKLTVIALKFDQFMDGRSFSQARQLRDNLDFTGEIRATGQFMQDQLYYLSRCGVDAFDLPEGITPESAVARLKDFSENYQAACDEPQPLFRRRG